MDELGESVTIAKAAMPFIHLRGDMLWYHSYYDVEDWIESGGSGPKAVRDRISHAVLQETYWNALQVKANREKCKEILEATYNHLERPLGVSTQSHLG